MLYVVGPAIAGQVNLQQNDFVEGVPSPLAALGFAGFLARKINEKMGRNIDPWSVRVLPVYHQVSVSSGRTRPAPRRDTPSKGGRSSLKSGEIAETLTGEVIFSLVIDIDAALDTGPMTQIVDRMRFAGSAIFPYQPRFSIPVRRLEGATLSTMRLPRGFAMTPPVSREQARNVSFGETEKLDAIGEKLSQKSEKGDGYIVPCAVGLRLLEDAKSAEPRIGGRDMSIPHVFAEPGVGFAEFISVRTPDLARCHPSELAPRMWSWSSDPSHLHAMFSPYHLSCLQPSS